MATFSPAARRFHHSALALTFLAEVIFAAPSAAQDTPAAHVGQVSAVYVRSASGSEVQGQLLQLGPNTLTLLERGSSRDIALADVSRIDVRGDSIKNGAIIGAVVLGAWCALICPQGLDGYNNRQLPYILGVNTVLGALVGAGIDAMHVGRTTIYRAGEATAGRRTTGLRATFSKRFRF